MAVDSVAGFTEVAAKVNKAKWSDLEVRQVDSILSDSRHQRWIKSIVTGVMTILVAVMNCAVVYLIYKVAMSEIDLLRSSEKSIDRMIDGKVYMALIAGTVAEVSALFFIIVRSTFKQKE